MAGSFCYLPAERTILPEASVLGCYDEKEAGYDVAQSMTDGIRELP